MAGVVYEVKTVYSAENRASGPTNQAAASADKASSAFAGLGKFASSAGSAMDSMATKLFAVGAGMAAIAGAGAIAAIKVGLVDVNARLETTQIGFATVFNTLGAAGSFQSGMGMAKELMGQIRQDAAALPGEFQDFVGMAQTLTSPLINAGKGMADIRNMTRDTVVSAAALGVHYDQAAREMAQLVEGHAGGHNVLGLRMGITAQTQVNGKDFNKASASDRMDFLQKAMAKAKDSLPAFQRSWDGLTSTLSDNMKTLLGKTTAPLFERIKGSLWSIVGDGGLLEKNQKRLDDLASAIGAGLVRAYDYAEGKVQYIAAHWDGIWSTTQRWGSFLRNTLTAVLPIATKIGGALGHALQDPQHLVKSLVALRMGLGAMSMAPGIAGAFSGGGAAAGAVGAVGAGAAVAVLAVAAVGAAGVLDVLSRKQEDASGNADRAIIQTGHRFAGETGKLLGKLGKDLMQMGENLWAAFQPVVDLVGVVLIGAFNGLVIALDGLVVAIGAIAGKWNDVWGSERTEDSSGDWNRDIIMGDKIGKTSKQYQQAEEARRAAALAGDQEKMATMAAKAAHKAGGGGKVNVQVNAPLQVLTDADPERIAKSIATIVGSHLKNPKTTGALAAARFA